MSLRNQLDGQLRQLIGFAAADPQTVVLSAPDQVQLCVDFTAVDTMSCSFREIRIDVPALRDAGIDTLKEWAEALCSRVTYLLENMGPLEVDADAGQVLIRSTPPDQESGTTAFYEVVLQSHTGGNFSLRRFRSEKGQPGRRQVDLQTTHEVLGKLADDLVETIPRN